MSDDQTPSILASGEKFAKEEAHRNTTVGFDYQKPPGQPGEATVTVGTAGSTKWFDWGVGAWFKRKFMPGGSSVGAKGEIKF